MPGAAETLERRERRFLFLQGPLSPLFRLIGENIRHRGHQVFRINLCAGDWLHWHGEGTVPYRGTVADWPAHIGRFLRENRITDLVLHGDQRVYHRAAVSAAAGLGIQIAVTELGYLRPGWMTLERNGLSTLSHFPAEPGQIRLIAKTAGPVDLAPRYPGSQYLQIVPDVVYNLANVFCRFLYPNYRRHTIYPPVLEYARGAVRMLSENNRNKQAIAQIKSLKESGAPYFILPLQLEGDFQLRRHSQYKSFSEVLNVILESFAGYAPQEASIVIKTHPLDVGYENWPKVIRDLQDKYGLGGRVLYLDGGSLEALFDKATGLVTLNSTAGLEALLAGCPVKCLVPAHYDVEGLTHSGPLESFWSNAQAPDTGLLQDYVTAIAACIQVRGSIHNREGVTAAAANIAERILKRQLNEPGGYLPEPPRLARARELGVPL
ncbi:capsular biosynthesis protein [Roseibium sp. RKSG952]|nr:capsular biosynthesis protein [Roseibium sp. RKSG952]